MAKSPDQKAQECVDAFRPLADAGEKLLRKLRENRPPDGMSFPVKAVSPSGQHQYPTEIVCPNGKVICSVTNPDPHTRRAWREYIAKAINAFADLHAPPATARYALHGFPLVAQRHGVDVLDESDEDISLTDAVERYRTKYGALEVVERLADGSETILRVWDAKWAAYHKQTRDIASAGGIPSPASSTEGVSNG